MIIKKPETTQRAQAQTWQALASQALPISLATGGPIEHEPGTKSNGAPLPDFAKGAPHESEKTGGVL